MFTKYIVVADDDVDVHNTSEVLSLAALSRTSALSKCLSTAV